MLADALASLDVALRDVDEPSQVIVVANGAPRSVYDGVAARFPGSNGFTATPRSASRARYSAGSGRRATARRIS